MAINVINSKSSLTEGEKYTLEQKLKKLLPSESYVYIRPIINGVEPDFVVLGKSFGVLIIEVKDWSDTYFEDANKQLIVCDGKKYKNPIRQIDRYINIVSNNITNVLEFTDELGGIKFPINPMIFFVNLSDKKISMHQAAFESPNVQLFSQNKLRTMTSKELLGENSLELSDEELNALRASIFPEIALPTKIKIDSDELIEVANIKSLDKEQEEFAKRIPNGHYMVTGLPGSGKTVMLLTRAIFLAQEHSDWNILIVTYTNALSNKLRAQLAKKIHEMMLPENTLERIKIITFHKLCHDMVGRPSQPKERAKEPYFEKFWPKEAIKALKVNPACTIFDSVLIDEYQDFHVDWFHLCRAVCKIHNGTENLFIAGDRLQRIYDVPWNSYKEIGINIQGKSKILKTPYRTHPNHIDFALKFLSLSASLSKDIGSFYELEKLSQVKSMNNCLDLIEGNYCKVNDYLYNLIFTLGVKPSDVLILSHNKFESESLMSNLRSEIKNIITEGKNPVENRTQLTTYHSSKGLEAKYCILLSVDKFRDNEKINRTLMYVGMTRASERLIIHYFESKQGFAKEIMEILPQT